MQWFSAGNLKKAFQNLRGTVRGFCIIQKASLKIFIVKFSEWHVIKKEKKIQNAYANTWHIAHLQGSFPLSPSKLISPPHYFCTSVKADFTLSLTLQVLVLNFANFTYCSRRLSIDASACSAWMIMQSTALLLPFPSFSMPHLHVLIATCSTMLNESGKNGRKSLFLILWGKHQ